MSTLPHAQNTLGTQSGLVPYEQSLEAKFEQFVGDKFKSMPSAKEDLLHAIVGISGEAGELLDAIKRHFFYNKPLDRENVREELGDIEFYLQAVRTCLGLDRKEILIANMVKLSKRYGSGSYSDEQAIKRADKVADPLALTETFKHSEVL